MVAAALLNFFFPPQCLICRQEVGEQGSLCSPCWGQIRFISPPFCAVCGLAFDFSAGDGALCGECLQEAPVFERARAVFKYDEHSRALITQLKYADQSFMAKSFGGWLSTHGREMVEKSDVIVAVPLHYWRFVGRRYNQSALLAYALAAQCGLKVIPDGLTRIRATKPQTSLTRAQRADNVRGAFTVTKRHTRTLAGKTVLLVDDVQTTSATITACSKALLAGGVKSVQVLTLARKMD